MRKSITLLLLLVVVSAFLIGCTSKIESTTKSDVGVTQEDVSPTEVADESVSGWVDENEEVQLGDMI